jgi:hypothetical protein
VWSLLGTFASQTNTRVYPDDVVVDTAGDVHIIWEWAYGQPRPDRHYGSYIKYETSTGTFKTANGTTVSAPVNLSTPGIFYQGLESGEVFTSANVGHGIQSAKLALGSTNRPSIVYRFRTDNSSNGSRDYEVFRIRWNGSSWVDKTSLFSAQDTIAALGHTIVNDRVRTYFVSNGKQLKIAEKIGSGAWTTYIIASDKPIERINVKVKDPTTDVIYATAPTEIDSNSGKLYTLFVDEDLTNIPLLPALSVFEAEDLNWLTSATRTIIADSNATNGNYIMLENGNVGDFIEFTLNIVQSGSYLVKFRYKTHNSRGITQAWFGGSNLGTGIDQYGSSAVWKTEILGNVTVTTSGNKTIRFTTTGNNSSSTGFKIAIDKILFEKQ